MNSENCFDIDWRFRAYVLVRFNVEAVFVPNNFRTSVKDPRELSTRFDDHAADLTNPKRLFIANVHLYRQRRIRFRYL